MQYSIIQKSKLEGGLRLDAEYYQPEYLELNSKLKAQNSKLLKDFLHLLYRYPTFYNLNYYDEGVLVLKGEDISSDGFIENQSQDYIFLEDAKRFPKTILREGDIVFSVRGFVGKVGIIDQKLSGSIISANLIRIVVENLSPYFLWAFLNSKYGVKQIERVKTITAQETIVADDIKNLLIPAVSKDKQLTIEKLAKLAIQEQENSKNFYSQAENLLLEELELKDFKVEDDLFYIVNLSEVKSAHRADAEYFQPKYKRIMAKIQKQSVKSIGELSELLGHATQSPYDEVGNIAVLAQKHMKRNLVIDTPSFDNYTTESLIKKSDKKFILKKGDVLISSAGEPGLTCIWTDDYQNKVIPGSFVTVVRFKSEIEPFYVGVFLNTTAGRLQFERDYTGSVQQYVYPVKIKEIMIPILPKSTQQKIAALVQKSYEARSKAKQLLEQAKQKVEDLI